MKIKLFMMAALLLAGCSACGGSDNNESDHPDTPDKPSTEKVDFAKGADISWYTEYDKKGFKFYNAAGQQRECPALMKELGLDAIRLRVWVDPKAHDNWCNKEDVVKKAKAAAALGMDVMIDFHYSDTWADPSKQYKPAAWKNLNLTDLKKAITDHTKDVLTALKSAGVTPKWVQVGNETRPGMLWDANAELSGASWDVLEKETEGGDEHSSKIVGAKNWPNLGAFIKTGYEAVKSVFPEAIVIVHLDNGYDNGMFQWFFDELKKNGGKWDMIGMSVYPYWTLLYHGDQYPNEDKVITDCISNINKLAARYQCDVMIVETGMDCGDGKGNVASAATLQQGKKLLKRLIKESREQTGGHCKGVFYWEPECRPNEGYRLGAFTNDGKPTAIMEAFKE